MLAKKHINLGQNLWKIDTNHRLGTPGGFGDVYAGVGTDGQLVAVKLIRPELTDKSHRELEAAKSFIGKKTAYIIPILDCGSDTNDGQSCIVMDRAEQNLRNYLVPDAPKNEKEAVEILLQLAKGLREAGDWIHRDLKPENILWHAGQWKITDFGIARIAEASTSINTLKGALTAQYAAPEQWDRKRATHATDVYALGCIGAEILTGASLFSGTEYEDFAYHHRNSDPVINIGSARFRMLLRRMLAKPAAARPSIADVIKELTSLHLKPETNRKGSLLLSESAAVVTEQHSRIQTAMVAQEEQNKEHQQLAKHALDILRDIAKELFRTIDENTSMKSAQTKGSGGSSIYEAVVGSGSIAMSVGHYPIIPAEVFQESNWKVVCGDDIAVSSSSHTRSASLWYADLGDGKYKWIETAYFCIGSTKIITEKPCRLPPGREAALAVSQCVSTWNLAYDPLSIEGEHTDRFCQRWVTFFAEAIQEKLTPPRHLPER